ncbi:MAG TPA: hypothetical protein VLA82_08155 [Actinomycetota bacterium]|nr:hypothetical protein [Actinomycetota bacterium]
MNVPETRYARTLLHLAGMERASLLAWGDVAALAVEGVGPLGIEIRAGLHTGEIQRDGDDVAGVAGDDELKSVPDRWRLYRVDARARRET